MGNRREQSDGEGPLFTIITEALLLRAWRTHPKFQLPLVSHGAKSERFYGSPVSPHFCSSLALVLIGTGIGVFTPANQKLAYASVNQQDYGVVAAMLSSLGTAAGTIGTTIVVALMEVRGGSRLWIEAGAFTGAQQYAFMWLVLVGAIGIAAGLKNQMRAKRNSK